MQARRPAFFAPLAAGLFGLLAAAAPAATAGTVAVSFVNAPSFEDAGTTSWEEQANLKALAEHLQGLGRRMLPPNQVLKVEVTDVDLAGSRRPTRLGSEIRVLRGGADWPRINLRYTLEVDGKPVRSGEERVADLDYARGISKYRESQSLYYEKRMLDDWFKARFADGNAAAAKAG